MTEGKRLMQKARSLPTRLLVSSSASLRGACRRSEPETVLVAPMIPDWQMKMVYVSHLLPSRHPDVWAGLQAALVANGIRLRQIRGTRDLWVRDFMPIQIDLEQFVKFRYEPDYLMGHEHLITGERVCRAVPYLRRCVRSPINLDGGNVVAAERKLILTEKVFKENPDVRRPDLRKKLQQLFQVDGIFIPREPFDPIGHADGIMRFIDNETALINDYSAIDKEYGRRLRAVLTKHRLNIEEAPYGIDRETEEGVQSAVGCYVNYLRTEKGIVMPTFGIKQDDAAVRKIETLFRGAPVIPLRCERLARKGGALNCCSWSLRTA